MKITVEGKFPAYMVSGEGDSIEMIQGLMSALTQVCKADLKPGVSDERVISMLQHNIRSIYLADVSAISMKAGAAGGVQWHEE